MHRLTTDLISQACRVFLAVAYPGDESAIPVKKRCFLSLPANECMVTHLANNAAVNECCQVLRNDNQVQALLVRLGCGHFPHLKLKVQLFHHQQDDLWLFSVDTHDAFSKSCVMPPADHPEAAVWVQLQAKNAALKERIEAAWEQAGLATFNSLLRRDLDQCRPSLA